MGGKRHGRSRVRGAQDAGRGDGRAVGGTLGDLRGQGGRIRLEMRLLASGMRVLRIHDEIDGRGLQSLWRGRMSVDMLKFTAAAQASLGIRGGGDGGRRTAGATTRACRTRSSLRAASTRGAIGGAA